MLIEGELASGGSITELTGRRLTVVTRVLACVDTSTFEGEEAEMRILNEAVYYYLRACDNQETVVEGVLAQLDRIPNGRGRTPFLRKFVGPMRRDRLALATMLALGITEESDIYAGILMGLSDLFAACQLMQEFPGMSLAEVSAATSI